MNYETFMALLPFTSPFDNIISNILVTVPILVLSILGVLFVANLLWSIAWNFLDDGEGEALDFFWPLFGKIFKKNVLNEDGTFTIGGKRGVLDVGGYWTYTIYEKGHAYNRDYRLYYSDTVDPRKGLFNWEAVFIIIAMVVTAPLLEHAPNFTMWTFAIVGSAFGARELRRLFKKIRKLGAKLTDHVQDKNAHGQS